MKSQRIGVCIVGLGRAGMIHARNFASRIPEAQLVAIADPSPEARAQAANELSVQTYEDFRAALDQPTVQAVVVACPTDLHLDVVSHAGRRNQHVLCEKPMAMTAQQCREMLTAVDKAGLKLQIGFMRRYDRSFVAAKEALDRGEIGEVVCVKSVTHGPSIPKPWQYDIRKSNGPLAEVNSHDIDTLRWLTGSEFEEVYAIAGNYRCEEARKDFPDFYDNLLLTARFVNGMQGLIDGAASVRYGYDARVEIIGTNGIIFIGDLRRNSSCVCTSDGRMIRPIVASWRDLFAEAYLAEDIDFIECILRDRPPRVSGMDGLRAVEVVNAGNRSILERRPVLLT
ncbi:MAG: Gfo/Idh/MocA family oxidoreductase [Planctomycetes bacterium]|nr:Gfo/Idh/MocA family oxidoreductase [Planctomycetota bacterium]